MSMRTASRTQSALERFSSTLDHEAAPTTSRSRYAPQATRSPPVSMSSRAMSYNQPPASPAPSRYASFGAQGEDRETSAPRGGGGGGGGYTQSAVMRTASPSDGALSSAVAALQTQVRQLEQNASQEMNNRLRMDDAVQRAQRFEQDVTAKLAQLQQAAHNENGELRSALAASSSELSDAYRHLSSTVESYNEEVEGRVNWLAKKFSESQNVSREPCGWRRWRRWRQRRGGSADAAAAAAASLDVVAGRD